MKKCLTIVLAMLFTGIMHAQTIENDQAKENSPSTPSRAQGSLLNENFSGLFPPAGWRTEGFWMTAEEAFANAGTTVCPKTNGDTYYAAFDAYSGNSSTPYSLVTPPLLPSAAYHILNYDVTEFYMGNMDDIASGIELYVEISTDNGETWSTGTEVLAANIPNHNTSSAHNVTISLSLDLSTYIGETIKVRFRAISDWGGFILGIDDVSGVYTYIADAPELEITRFTSLPYSQIPLAHVKEYFPSATIVNNGRDMTSFSNITFSGTLGGYSETVIIPDLGSLELFTASPSVGYTPTETGSSSITGAINFTDENMENNVATKTFEVTNDIYAMDYGFYVNSVGESGGSLGNLFELRERSVIESFYAAFSSSESATFTFRIYSVNNEENSWSLLLYESESFNRSEGVADELKEYAITPQTLPAGKYLFAVYSTDDIGVSSDGITPSVFYTPQANGDLSATINSPHGNLAIRIKTTIAPEEDCSVIYPLTMGFEPFESAEMLCWTSISMNNNFHNRPGASSNQAYNGSRSWRFSSLDEVSNYNQYLISPELVMEDTNMRFISFYYRAESGSNTESFRVGYSTTDNQTSSFTWGENITCSSTDWNLFETDIPSEVKYIAINYNVTSSQQHLYIDDITIRFAFIDPCLVYSFPYSESFERPTFPTNCWRIESTDNFYWERVTSGVNPTCTPHDGIAMLQFNSSLYGSNGKRGILISPPLNISRIDDPAFSFWMYRDNSYGSFDDYINIYISDTTVITGASLLMTVHRLINLSPTVTTTGWYNFIIDLPTDIPVAYMIIEGVSGFGYNMFIDDFSIFSSTLSPRTIISRTPDINETSVAIDAEVSIAFNMNITGLNLSEITITPNPGNVQASISGAVLTITHDDFDYNTRYTVTIPANSIQAISEEISWSFTTTVNCLNITYPYVIDFNHATFPPDCWTTTPTTGNNIWSRQVSGSNPYCSTHEGSGMIRFYSYMATSGSKGYLISPELNNTDTEPLLFNFWMYRNATAGSAHVNIYASPTPVVPNDAIMTINRRTTLTPVVSAYGWYEYTVDIPEDLSTFYLIIEGVADYNSNIFMDKFVLSPESLFPREILSRTPGIDESQVAINAEVSATFNKELTAIDLEAITISPDPGGVSATIAGNILTIAHNDFEQGTTYTVTIPSNSIENVADEITWSFATAFDCNAITLPHRMGFEYNEAFECWTSIYSIASNAPGKVPDPVHSGVYSWRFSSYFGGSDYNQYLISPELPTQDTDTKYLSFYYRKHSSGLESFRVGYSTTDNQISNFVWLENVTDIIQSWRLYENFNIPPEAKYIAIHYNASSSQWYLYIDDITINHIDDDFPRSVVSRTPDIYEMQVEIDALVSVTFNLNINAIDLSGITITPDPGGVSASVSGNVLTIAHDNFEYNTEYTVTIPEGSIENVAGEISWPFTTTVNCTNITYPYTIGFNDALFPPDCWRSRSSTSTPWKRVTSDSPPICYPQEGNGMIEYNSYNYQSGSKGILISPALDNSEEPLVFKFYMYRDGGMRTTPDKVNIYFSETQEISGTPAMTIHRSNTLSPVSATGWNEYLIELPSEMSTVYIIIEGESSHGYNIFMDYFVIAQAGNLPREIVSRTPDINETSAALNAEVSVTFNLELTAIDLTNITITPNPGGVSASVSGNKLTITHDDFEYNTPYTVRIPAGSIENVVGEISWSFITTVNCSNITYPYTISFNEATFPPECWQSESSTSTPWNRVTTGTNPTCSPQEGNGMIQYNCFNYYLGNKGILISPALDNSEDPLAFSFYMYRDEGVSADQDKVNIYFSETPAISGTPAMTIHRNNTLSPVSATGWNQYLIGLPSNMANVYIIVEGESDFGNNIYMDHFVIAPAGNLPREVISRTPDINETSAALNAEVSVTFNLDLTAIDLTNITITPNPGGVSASVSGNKLTITHDDFEYNTPYTVTIPAGSIENVAGEISWSFTTTVNCSNITYPYTISFNEATFPPSCWQSESSTSTPWGRVITGIRPTCAPQEGNGMIEYNSFDYQSGSKGILISPALDNSEDLLAFSFYMYRDNGIISYQDKVNIYFSETPAISGTPAMTIHRNNTLSPASGIGWNQYLIGLPSNMANVYIIVEGESAFGNNIYMDYFVIAPAGDLPREVISRTPEINETNVAIDAEVSVTFNLELTAIDLTNITITPNPGGVSASVSGNKLTITHDDFEYNTPYTVTIPAGSIENVAGEISWSFSTISDCNSFSFPITMGFENNELYECWTSISMNEIAQNAPIRSTTNAHTGTYSWRFSSFFLTSNQNQYLISPPIPIGNEGKSLSFYYIKGYSGSESFRVGYSTTNNQINSFTWFNSVNDASSSWKLYETLIPVNARYVAINYQSENQYYLYVDDISIDTISGNTPPTILARTPQINEMNVAIDAPISVTFNVNINPINLSGITISPNPGGVSTTISGNVLNITHQNFEYNTIYTVTIPAGSIENVADAISWSFTTNVNCSNITYPYTISFNEATFPPDCWQSESSTSKPWKRVTTGTNPTCAPQEGNGMIQYNCFNYSLGNKGILISPLLDNSSDPLAFSFYMYRDEGVSADQDKVNIYFSETPAISGTPAMTIHRNNTLSPVSATGWNQYMIGLPTNMANVYIIVEGESDFGNNIYMDHFVIAPAGNLPREIVSRTPDINETGAALNAEVSVTFNLELTAIDLTNITITPNPGGVSASVSGNKLTITHDDFEYESTYTVRIPAGSIENVAGEISWSFTTTINCSNITYPYTIGFNDATFPPNCWQSQSSTSTPWMRVIIGIRPTCAPQEGNGMIQYNSFDYQSGNKGILISPALDNSEEPLVFKFYMYRDGNMSSSQDKVNIYFSETPTISGTPAMTIHRSSSLSPVSAIGWNEYLIDLPTEMSTVYIIIEGESRYGYNIYMDHFVIAQAGNLPREIVSRTPDINEIGAALNAEVSVTFNLDLTAIDLTNITITPDPGDVSASVSGNKLTITHDDFEYNTPYTVTIPAGSIENVAGEISWSFTTTVNCSNITYPYTIGFNDATFPPSCWQSESSTSTPWGRVTTGIRPTCAPQEGNGMILYNSYNYQSGGKGILISPALDNSEEPLVFKFYMYRDVTMSSFQDKVNIYFSETPAISGTPAMTIHRSTTLSPVSAAGWNEYLIDLPTEMSTVYIIIEGESSRGYNIYMDHFVIAQEGDFPREIVSRTPDINETSVALNAEVSATYNLDLTAIDLTGITITPDPGGISASVSGTILTIEHDDFEYGTTYTVNIPQGTIEHGVEVSWSFTTLFDCNTEITLPYTMNFDFGEGYECWTSLYTGSVNIPGPTTDQAYTGTHSWRLSSMSSNSDYNQYLISPELPVTPTEKNISFYYRRYNNWEELFKVGYSTTDNAPTSFTWFNEVNDASATWKLYEKSEIPREAKYIAIHYYSDWSYHLYIDNITISYIIPPSIVSYSPNIDETQVDLGAPVSVTFDRNIMPLHLNDVTITPDPGGVSATTSGDVLSIAHNRFTPYTTYIVNVPVNTIRNFNEPITWSFTTGADCDIVVDLPYTLGFEDDDSLDCWKSISMNEENITGYTNSPTHSDLAAWQFSSMTPATDYNQYLISSKLPITSQGKQLFFYYRSHSSNANEVFRVGYSTTNNQIGSFTWLNYTTNASTTWQLYDVDLPANTQYIAVHYASVGQEYLYIDDLTIEEITPPTPLAYSPEINQTRVAIDAAVSVTFDMDISALNLSGITIFPNPSAVSATISGNTLTIAHNDFDFLTTYTVNIPNNAIRHYDQEISWSFTTTADCDLAVDLPYTMGFEAEEIIDCWTSFSMNEENMTGYSSNPTHSGLAAWAFSSAVAADDYHQYLISPKLTVTAAEKYFSFYYRKSNSTTETFRIGYSTTDNSTGSFIWLTTVGDAVNTDWLLYESILPEGTQYIAIHYNTGNNANELYIDDITIHYAHQLTASVSHYHDYGTTPVAAIAPENAYVIHNESKEVTITIEDPAYDLYALLMTVGGEEPIDITDAATQTGNVYSYMVNNITEDTHVEAVIKVKDFTLNFTVQSGKGEVNGVFYDATTTPQTFQQTVNYEYSFMLDPDYGYVVEDLIIDGVSVGTSEQYDFEHIVADHQVDIYFAPGTFIITTEVVEGEGSISQGDTFVFDPDYVFDFEVEANEDAGFRIAYITIDDQVIPGTIGAELLSYNGSIPAPIGENHSIKAYFGNVSIIYTIHSGNGYIENMPNVVTVTDEPEIIQIWSVAGTDHLAYFSPDIGYQIGQVLINGVDFNTIDEYLFENVTEAQYVDIYFERKTYTITTQTYGNGTIIPGDTSFLFDPDYVYEYTILPDEGYNISSILINGDTVEFTDPEIFTGTLENIIENYLIEAYFTIKQFTVTATAHEGGSINPEGTAVYDWNSSPEYTATPSEGYYISEILLDGEPQTIDDNQLWSYTFTNINADHTIEVTFDRLAYTITVVQGENGTISPGTSSVYWGESMSFTITPGLGYLIENVIVDGVNMGAISNYTFTDVREPHTITASFEIRTFTVTAIQPENGTITPAGVTTVNYNENATYTITPNVGYEIISITVNGIAVAGSFDDEGVATYTISGITENKEITATLIPRTYTITVENTENGTITPGTSVVEHGEAISFTITPAPRYEIARLIIDGNDTTPEPTYTFTNVTANHTIRAEFILTPCEKPSNLYAGDITHESAILHWDDIGAESYIVEYKAIDAPYFNAAIATTNQYAYTNLLEQTTYVWRVMAVCEIGYESEWTELSTFTTLESSIRDNALSQISVYAHQNHVNIVNEAGIAIKQIDIFDIYGRQIYRGKTSESREVITLSVTSGTYMVRLVTNQGVGIYKVAIIW